MTTNRRVCEFHVTVYILYLWRHVYNNDVSLSHNNHNIHIYYEYYISYKYACTNTVHRDITCNNILLLSNRLLGVLLFCPRNLHAVSAPRPNDCFHRRGGDEVVHANMLIFLYIGCMYIFLFLRRS